jgi:hypothetical protein
MLLASGAKKKWRTNQTDFVTAYLNGTLEEKVFVQQLRGFKITSTIVDWKTLEGDLVCVPIKALYGLKQAWRAWIETSKEHLLSIGFVHSQADALCEQIRIRQETHIGLYVDDIAMRGNSSICSGFDSHATPPEE